jgi:hypothetical protein
MLGLKRGLSGLSGSIMLALVACGGSSSDGPPPVYTTEIVSDPAYDGDIAQTSATTYIVTQGMNSAVQSVFAGIDPSTSYEYRAFLDFPLGGPNGVPTNAIINSAFLDFYADSLQPASGSLPLRIELVAFQPPTLFPTDFDRTQLQALGYIQVSPPIDGSDVHTNISIDVTPLMIQAQQAGLVDFQLRIMEDLGPAIPVILEIDDTTDSDRDSYAPQLTVTYN